MAKISNSLTFFISLLISTLTTTNSQPSLNSVEQESVYKILDSLNSDISWRSLFPDDLCSSAPHGVVCGYTTLPTQNDPGTVNILELNFGYVSDHNPNPPCNANSTLPDPFVFSSFIYLRKLFFYNCFTQRPVSLQAFSRVGLSLEELVFIENPSLFGSLTEVNGDVKNLKRLVITGTNVSGEIPDEFCELQNLEEVTLCRNKFAATLPENLSNLKKLKILDVSQNEFVGNIPATIGDLPDLIKLDLGKNQFSGEFPASMKGLKSLELLDLSYNNFSRNGIPLFLSELSKLKGLYLSGNELGGVIPDIWGKLRGLNGVGFSGLGLVGNIPSSIGVFLGNLSYLGLDNNKLTGKVPLEFERLKNLNELNLKNNNLSGRITFSAKFVSRVGKKFRVDGNHELCVDERVVRSFDKVNASLGKLKVCDIVENSKSAILHVFSSSSMGHKVVGPLAVVMFVWLLFI